MNLRKSLARKLFRDINIHRLDEAFMTDLIPTHKVRDSGLETRRITPSVKINISKFPGLAQKREFAVRIKSVNFMTKTVTTRRFKIKRFTKQDIRVKTLQKFNMKTWSGYKKIIAMPQERSNRLKFIKTRPQVLNNEMILAWYGPIVDGAVIKLALNKQRGTLLVWYNPRSRQFNAKGVYLIRRLGLGSKPEWRWV
ncbi:MAG: hypothetical protein IJP48_09925 [Synergistaceae bacterium]|nr:hypothetical protein [Synergistaceae bacterium]